MELRHNTRGPYQTLMNIHNGTAMQSIVQRESDDTRQKCVVQNPYVDPERVSMTKQAIELALLRGNRAEADACLDRHFEAVAAERVTGDSPIAVLQLAMRTFNGLEAEGIFTVAQLAKCTPGMLLEMPNFGQRTLRTIRAELHAHGFELANDTPAAEGQTHSPEGDAVRPGFRRPAAG